MNRSRGTDTNTERGTVTVEAAIALCALVALFSLILAGAAVIFDQLRCTDAAGEAARLVARGESGRAEQAVSEIAPRGARLTVRSNGDSLNVIISARSFSGLLPGVRSVGSAYAVLEPGVDPDQALEEGEDARAS